MATKADIKKLFETGDQPTGADFELWINSCIFENEELKGALLKGDSVTEAALSSAVRTKLNAHGVGVDGVTIEKNAAGNLQIKLQGVDTDQIKDGSVTQAKLHSSVSLTVNVDNVTIEKNSAGELKLKAVREQDIQAGAVTTTKILNDNVTEAKLATSEKSTTILNTVRGGVNTSYNDLKKLYDYTNSQFHKQADSEIIEVWSNKTLLPGKIYATRLDVLNSPITLKLADGRQAGDTIVIYIIDARSDINLIGSDNKKPSDNGKIHNRYRSGSRNFPDKINGFSKYTVLRAYWDTTGTDQWMMHRIANPITGDGSTIGTIQSGENLAFNLMNDAVTAAKIDNSAFATTPEAKGSTLTKKIISPKTLGDVITGHTNSLLNGATSNYNTFGKIEALIRTNINDITNLKALGSIKYTVADITARNSLTGLKTGDLVFVTDASTDATVNRGWAIYRYSSTRPNWLKIAENESLDVVSQVLVDGATIDKDGKQQIQVKDDGLSTVKYKNLSVTAPKLGAKAVTTTKLDDKAVTAAKLDDNSVSYKKLDNKALATTHEFSLGRVSWADYITDSKDVAWNASEKGNQLNSNAGSGKAVQFKQRFSLPLNKKMKFSVFAKCIEDTTPNNKHNPTLGLEVYVSKADGSGYAWLPTKEAKFSLNETKTVELEFEVDKDGKTANNQKFDEFSYFYLKILATSWGKFVLYSVVLKDVVEENDLSTDIKRHLVSRTPHPLPHYDWHRDIKYDGKRNLDFHWVNLYSHFNYYTLNQDWAHNKFLEWDEGLHAGYIENNKATGEFIFYLDKSAYDEAKLEQDSQHGNKLVLELYNSDSVVARINCDAHDTTNMGYVVKSFKGLKTFVAGNFLIVRVYVELDITDNNSFKLKLTNDSPSNHTIRRRTLSLSFIQYSGYPIAPNVTDIPLYYERFVRQGQIENNAFGSNNSKTDVPSMYSLNILRKFLSNTVGGFSSGNRNSGDYKINISVSNITLFRSGFRDLTRLINGKDNLTYDPDSDDKVYFNGQNLTSNDWIEFDFSQGSVFNSRKDYDGLRLKINRMMIAGHRDAQQGEWYFKPYNSSGTLYSAPSNKKRISTNRWIYFDDAFIPCKKFRMVGVSGATSSGPFLNEIYFEYTVVV